MNNDHYLPYIDQFKTDFDLRRGQQNQFHRNETNQISIIGRANLLQNQFSI